MPDFLLRNSSVVRAYPNVFTVILVLDDGYELEAGHISEQMGSGTRKFWAWNALPDAKGRSGTREEAMVALKAGWAATPQDIADARRQQESTEAKYALFDAGYKSQIAAGEIRCPCGTRFDPSNHDATMAHIGHIKAGR